MKANHILLSASLLSLLSAATLGPALRPARRSPKPTGQAAARRNTQTRFDVPHGGGAREVARRQRQLAAGTLRTN